MNLRKKIETFILSKRKLSVLLGFLIAKKKLTPGKQYHYFIKSKPVGDLVRTLPAVSLFRHYRAAGPDEKMVVLIQKLYAGLPEMNPDVDEVRIMSKFEMNLLSVFSTSRRNRYSIYRDDTFIKYILPRYGIPEAFAEKNKDLLRIPQALGKKSVERGTRFIAENNIGPGKTLILFPSARSSSSLDNGELDSVVDFYHTQGYRIFTAVISGQKPVNRTEPISIPADVLFAVISRGAAVIGVQNGMMDTCEYMGLSERMIKVYLLNTDRDLRYFKNRNGDLSRRIEKKDYGYTIAVSTEEERARVAEDIIEISRSFLI